VPQKIKGFGHIKARNLDAAKNEQADLLARFRSPTPTLAAAAE
jgi:indolepyruvate ferredoxin oxidoreductase